MTPGGLTSAPFLHTVCCMQLATDAQADQFTANVQTREQAAYDALRRAITAGRWHPGETLVVSRIALDLGVSRITVANALKRLAGEGFVLLRPHKEAVVAAIDPAHVREIYLMRAALEAVALREVAARATEDALLAPRTVNGELRRLRDGGTATMADIRGMDRVFHRRLRDIAAMPRLAQTLENLADQCEYYRACLLDQSRLAAPKPDEHDALLAAVSAHDAGRATALIEAHVVNGMHLILAVLEQPA